MHLAMERSLLSSSARFRPQLSSLPEKTLTLRAVFSNTNPSFRAGIRCGLRDGPRKPLSRRRVLSKEAIQAVQALKLAKSSPSSPAAASAPGDGRMAEIFRSRIARLLKVDLLDVLKELQRQNEWEIALQVFDFIKKEVWYKPDSSLYTDMILMMGRNKLIENAEELLLELEKEGVRPDTRAFTEIIGAFLHIGDVQKAMSIYKLMKDSSCNPDKLTFTILIKNLEKIGENDLATAVRGDYEQYVDYPEKFLEDLGKNYPKRRPNTSTLYQQFLTSKVSQINYLGFRLYRALPFLYELRCVLDWSCTTTSLTMYDWLKLEDINSSLFLVKCDAVLNRASHQQGQKQSKMTKFCSGICLFFILICVIWAPMLMYSSGNPTNIANPIKDVSVQIDIKAAGGKLTPFQTTLCEILPYQSLEIFDKNYLDMYNVQDIQLICCQSDASTMWLVPPVVQLRYIRSLNSTMQFVFTWIFMRERPRGKETVKSESLVEQPPSPDEVKEVLNGTERRIRLLNAYPRYFRVTSSGEVRRLEQTVISVSGDLFLNHGSPSWWSFHDANASDIVECNGMSGPIAIVVSEETPQGIIGETLSKFSIWSLYITFVLAVGRFIRLQCSDLRMRIPFENLPSCDRLIAICEDIYAARAEGELEVEEGLYWTLVKIYRSPHVLLEYTKPD